MHLLRLAAITLYFASSPAVSFATGTEEGFTPEIPFDQPRRQVECEPLPEGELADPAPVFELMNEGPERAVACVAFLEETMPGWHQAKGAESLVVPFVSYLLGDGTAHGLQRHAIFIQLLGHLEEIEPGWRFHPSARPMMPEIILGSVVEDPFVANFWSTALREMDPEWRESDAARSLLPTIYELAYQEETKTAGPHNERPKWLLKELSWTSYARLQLATRVFGTWPKRIFWILMAVLVGLAVCRRLFGR